MAVKRERVAAYTDLTARPFTGYPVVPGERTHGNVNQSGTGLARFLPLEKTNRQWQRNRQPDG